VKLSAQTAIAAISEGGSTSIGAGLETAQNELSSKGKPADAHAIILLSDGYENTPPYVSDILPTIPDKTDIYTIALGPDSDQQLLNDIATQTGGKYYMAPTTEELNAIYDQIAGKVAGGGSIVGTVVGWISTTVSHVFHIDSSVSKARFQVGWSGSHLDMTLRSP